MSMKKPLVIKQPRFAEFIRELRQITGLTQEQFAAALGVTYPTINRWENNKSTASLMAMKLIQKMLQELEGDCGQELLKKYTSYTKSDC